MRVHFERAGAGSPLLLLHGIGSSSRSFRHQMDTLSDAYDVIAWDAPGYGRSEDPAVPFTLEDLADEAVGLLADLDIDRAHLLGVSLGGVVAQLIYQRHPARVRSLILADTTPGGGAVPEPTRSQRVRQRLESLERLGPRGMAEQRAPQLARPQAPPQLIAELIEIMAEVRPAGYRAAAIALGDTDLRSRLGQIRAPTLVIHGECDGVVPLSTARELTAAIPDARLVVIPDAGHVANQEQPEAFNAVVREFLSTV